MNDRASEVEVEFSLMSLVFLVGAFVLLAINSEAEEASERLRIRCPIRKYLSQRIARSQKGEKEKARTRAVFTFSRRRRGITMVEAGGLRAAPATQARIALLLLVARIAPFFCCRAQTV